MASGLEVQRSSEGLRRATHLPLVEQHQVDRQLRYGALGRRAAAREADDQEAAAPARRAQRHLRQLAAHRIEHDVDLPVCRNRKAHVRNRRCEGPQGLGAAYRRPPRPAPP